MHFHGKIYKTKTLLAAAWTLSQLQHPHPTFSPTGPRMLEDRLVVPGTYTALCTSRRRQETLEEQQKENLDSKAYEIRYWKH